jgi:ribosomal-protein-alanine N-acetyltransferase
MNMNDEVVTFRAMALRDVDRVLQIERASFTAPWSRSAFVGELTQNHFARYSVVCLGERIVGYGGMWLIVDEAHVTNIAVAPDVRGQGLGERLLRYMMALAVAQGSGRMTLEVRVSNETAQNLYRKMGFEESGVRPGYYTDNREDALIMWAPLPPQSELSHAVE